MKGYEFQTAVTRTMRPGVEITPEEACACNYAMGICGEAGEVSELIKKAVFHKHQIDTNLLLKELGDVLWYVAAMCEHYELSIDDAMLLNVQKLRLRYPEGFSTEASKERKDAK